jgi:uncharacterized heparinase superfamily protein
MNRVRSTLGLIARLPTVLRTLAHLKPLQLRAQIHHSLFGPLAPRRLSDSTPTPTLAIAASYTPVLGPPAHVKSLEGSRIELLSTPFDLAGGIAWETKEHGPLFSYHLHQHEFLRLPGITAVEREAHLRDWIQHHPAGIGWDPHPISLRLICWGKLLITPGALEPDGSIRDEMLRSMAAQVETLRHGLEIRLQANHLLSNLISTVFVGLLLDGESSEAWKNHAEALLRELELQVRPDGGHEERSPMYHCLLIENVLDLLNLCLASPARAPLGLGDGLREVASRMLGALELFTHPDGRIALFGDSAFDVAAEPGQLREYAARLGISLAADFGSGYLPQTGYLRLCVGGFDLIASVAGPAPSHQPGHAHCDALAFELSVAGDRLVTDTGLFEYLPGPRRDRARRTGSHSTLQVDAAEQAEIWAAHRVGGRPVVELTAWDDAGSAEATCRGWSRRAPLHRRFFCVECEGVSIVDRLEGRSRELRLCLPIDPAWQVELFSGRARATRESEQGVSNSVEIELPSAFDWRLERSFYYPSFGIELERFVLVGTGSRCEEAITRFRRVD